MKAFSSRQYKLCAFVNNLCQFIPDHTGTMILSSSDCALTDASDEESGVEHHDLHHDSTICSENWNCKLGPIYGIRKKPGVPDPCRCHSRKAISVTLHLFKLRWETNKKVYGSPKPGTTGNLIFTYLTTHCQLQDLVATAPRLLRVC